MAQKTLITRIQTKRDTAANWELRNPVLLNGEEIIVDTSAGEVRKKIGDGVKKYTQLPFTDEALRNLITDSGYSHPATHPATMITQDATHKFVTDTQISTWNAKASTAVATTSANGLMSSTMVTKLNGIADNANNYSHPSTHPATMITEDTDHKFVTDTQISTWNAKASTTVATTTTNGLMSAAMVTKLNGIADGATKIVVDSALSSTSTNPVQNKIINSALAGKSDADHTHTKADIGLANVENKSSATIRSEITRTDVIDALGYTPPTTDTKYTHPTSHPASMIIEDLTHQFVTENQKSVWDKKASTALVTTTTNGLMGYSDKNKLNGIEAGATKTVVDSALSSTSTNPVQNKIINSALAGKAASSHTHTKSQITDFPTSLPASDVSAWAKAATKPTYTAAEVGADVSGAAAGALTSANSYTDTKISDLINGAPTTLDTLKEIADAMATNDDVVKALETAVGTKANASDLTDHTGNTTVHITATERTNWGKAYTHSTTAHAPSNAQANQNAFSNVKIGTTTIAAEAVTDTLELVGSNVTLTPDATNDKVTIGITKDNVTSALGYTPPTTDTKYTHPGHTAHASGLYKVTVDSLGHVSAVTAVTKADITALGIPGQDTNTTYGVATTSTNGLMASTDKSNLNSALSRIATLETNYASMLAKLKTAVFYTAE